MGEKKQMEIRGTIFSYALMPIRLTAPTSFFLEKWLQSPTKSKDDDDDDDDDDDGDGNERVE